MNVLSEVAHRRYNPLTGEWVLVSPHRAKRPWQGKQETITPVNAKPYEPTCYLCPGNTRVHGQKNPEYTHTFVFDNDHPALTPEPSHISEIHPLLKAQSVQGTARVICFSPQHNLSLANMEISAIQAVIHTWAEQVTDLGQTYPWVQVFENKGEIMGCSSPHPHGQVWACSELPNEAAKEDRNQKAYFQQHSQPLLLAYVQLEEKQKERIVVENSDWLVVVPFWAVWPFETLILPKFEVTHLPQLTDDQRHTLAKILKDLLMRYDRLFNTSFPYSFGWHGAPQGTGDYTHWQLHGHIYPPLLRSATVKKFMVGYEMLAEAQRDMTPEQAAEKLRTIVFP